MAALDKTDDRPVCNCCGCECKGATVFNGTFSSTLITEETPKERKRHALLRAAALIRTKEFHSIAMCVNDAEAMYTELEKRGY